MSDLNSELDIDLNLELLLNILLHTTQAYMEAFDIDQSDIDLSINLLEKYQAFKEMTAYYMDENEECVSYVTFKFDWDKYELQCNTEDPDIVMNRKYIIDRTPKQILMDACNVIKERVATIKKERGVTRIRLIYSYSDKVRQDNQLLKKVRSEGNLVPFKEKMKFSKKIHSIGTRILSSLTENTLTIEYIT